MLQSCFSRSCWLWSAASSVGSKMTGTREGVTEGVEMIDFMVGKNHAGVILIVNLTIIREEKLLLEC